MVSWYISIIINKNYKKNKYINFCYLQNGLLNCLASSKADKNYGSLAHIYTFSKIDQESTSKTI